MFFLCDLCRISAVLQWKPARNVPQSDELERDVNLPAWSSHFGGSPTNYITVHNQTLILICIQILTLMSISFAGFVVKRTGVQVLSGVSMIWNRDRSSGASIGSTFANDRQLFQSRSDPLMTHPISTISPTSTWKSVRISYYYYINILLWNMFSPRSGWIDWAHCLLFTASAPEPPKEGDVSGYKDWVFINYTFKRFEGLTQRGVLPSHMKKWWTTTTIVHLLLLLLYDLKPKKKKKKLKRWHSGHWMLNLSGFWSDSFFGWRRDSSFLEHP